MEDLTKLKILDLRFNRIRELPDWIYRLNKKLYWERGDGEEEGVFLEGNPLPEDIIAKIKTPRVKPLQLSSKRDDEYIPKIDKLIPINRQHVTIFLNREYNSSFANLFIQNFRFEKNMELKLNISTVEYSEKGNERFIFERMVANLKYVILILNEVHCCIYPAILKEVSKIYPESRIFLIIESFEMKSGIKERIGFIKQYNRSKNIIEIYHVTNQNGSDVREKIFDYLNSTQEVNSLWMENWILLR